MIKLTTKDNWTKKQFKPQVYQCKRRAQTRNFYDNVIMITETMWIGIDQIAEIEESNIVVQFSTGKIIEVDPGMNKTIGMTKGEEILEVTWECIRVRF